MADSGHEVPAIGSVNPSSKVPQITPGIDVRTLPLTPTDGFVLSRISGTSSVHDIAIETGLPDEMVIAAIDKLRGLRVVHYAGEAFAISLPPPPPPSKPDAAPPQKASAAPPRGSVGAFDPRELDEDCDLDRAQRQRVLELFYGIEERSHYELLGVDRTTEKKAIKRAYYDVAMAVHPDKFFRKNLGSFKAKMEKVFALLTIANDTLTDKVRRAEYDATLGETSAPVQIRIPGPPASVPAPADPNPSPKPAPVSASPMAAAATPTRPPAPFPTSYSQQLRAPSPAEIQARKDALARRLTGQAAPGAPVPPPVPAPPPSAPAMDALRRRYEERVDGARDAQAKKYVEAAERALTSGDPVAAANAFRVAATYQPENERLAARVVEVEAQAHGILAEQYLKQATAEEKNANWVEAARSWSRLAKIRPQNAKANERAANAITKADGNLHEAADFAKKAVELEPHAIESRLTLAYVYLAAGLVRNARREAETAARTAPTDPLVIAALKRIPKAV